MSELTDLLEVAALTPEKASLVRAVLRAAENAVDPDPAVDWLARIDPAPHDVETRAAVARFLAPSGDGEAALRWAEGTDPRLKLERARTLLLLDRIEEAAEAYAAAVGADSMLADPELDAALALRQASADPKVVSLHGRRPVDTAPTNAPTARRETKMFADVGGLESVKKDITRKIILPFKQPALFNKFKRKSGGGILLFGPPGCGKTMLARATAGEVRRRRSSSSSISEILDMYIGQSREAARTTLFETGARVDKPTRALLRRDRSARRARRRYRRRRPRRAAWSRPFLTEFDGVHADNEGVLDPRRHQRAVGDRRRVPPARPLRPHPVHPAARPRSALGHPHAWR